MFQSGSSDRDRCVKHDDQENEGRDDRPAPSRSLGSATDIEKGLAVPQRRGP